MSHEQSTGKRPPLPMFQRARELRRKATPAEERLWSIVRGRRCGGFRFLRQAPAGHYVLDFYCPAARLAIEVDGAVHDVPGIRLNDEEREAALAGELRITVWRLTNDFVLGMPKEAVRASVVAAVGSALEGWQSASERPGRVR